jgi:hypothetical protein
MTEDKLQQDCFLWHNKEYPTKRGLLYHNFNNPRNAIQGAKLKSLGLVPGVADLTLLHNKKAYFFELKTSTGKQSPKQKKWEQTVKKDGFNYYIIRDIKRFKELILYIYNNY